ncbi:MAG TPA: hypothetical protein VMN36_10950 [Verrucomicrobiales bacterium]|nr:hypothetical protein [Verrucomicrobiales bacterium]
MTGSEEWNLGTNPGNPDTDADTLPDGWEIAHGMDPLTPNLDYYDKLRKRAFAAGEPVITIGRDKTVSVEFLRPIDGSLLIDVELGQDLQSWSEVQPTGTAEDLGNGWERVRVVYSPPSFSNTGFVRIGISEPDPVSPPP